MEILPTILNIFPIELVDFHISLHFSTKGLDTNSGIVPGYPFLREEDLM